jgi:aerobic C4-dicarboxylate transport protein
MTTKGAAGVSGAALVVLGSVHVVPVFRIALMLGIHRILASAFTVPNIIGNCVAILVIACLGACT